MDKISLARNDCIDNILTASCMKTVPVNSAQLGVPRAG